MLLHAILLTQVLRNIPFFFIAFVIFLIVVNYCFRKSTKQQQRNTDAFWERENLANSTRRQDVTNLPYISIPDEILPQAPATAAQEKLCRLKDQQILNLTGKSNTDLKMEYGVANLEFLSACDDRFTDLCTSLSAYGAELLAEEQQEKAKAVYAFGVEIGADIKSIYLEYARLCIADGDSSVIDRLISSAEGLNSLSKTGIINALTELKNGPYENFETQSS